MWNDTDIPLAVFFTFRCYGTWLHGDERESVDRNHNTYGTPRVPATDNWRRYNEHLLLHPPVTLDAARRRSVEKAIRGTCNTRGWTLLALNVRTNHVHAVVAVGAKAPKDALIALKANATRQLREDGLWTNEHTPWADKASEISGMKRVLGRRLIMLSTNRVINCLTSISGRRTQSLPLPVLTMISSYTITDGGELTHSYSAESGGEVKMAKQEIIEMIHSAGFDPVELGRRLQSRRRSVSF